MSPSLQPSRDRLSPQAVAVLILLVGGGLLALLVGQIDAWIRVTYTVVIEGAAALAIVAAAGGFGWLALKWLFPADAPAGLKAVTACLVGLWLLSTAVLAVGSATTGLLRPWLW